MTTATSAAIAPARTPSSYDDGRAQELARHLGLVHHLARRLLSRANDRVEYDDLVSAGCVGLVQAFDSFDPSRAGAFSTFAVPRIRGAMLDELRRCDTATRAVKEKRRTVARAQQELTSRLGRSPVISERAGHLGIDAPELFRLEAEAEAIHEVSLDSPLAGSGSASAEELVACAAERPDAALEREQSLQLLREGLVRLPEQDRLVLTLYYLEELNLRQIGVVLGVSESRVSQLRTRALARMREELAHVMC